MHAHWKFQPFDKFCIYSRTSYSSGCVQFALVMYGWPHYVTASNEIDRSTCTNPSSLSLAKVKIHSIFQLDSHHNRCSCMPRIVWWKESLKVVNRPTFLFKAHTQEWETALTSRARTLCVCQIIWDFLQFCFFLVILSPFCCLMASFNGLLTTITGTYMRNATLVENALLQGNIATLQAQNPLRNLLQWQAFSKYWHCQNWRYYANFSGEVFQNFHSFTCQTFTQ